MEWHGLGNCLLACINRKKEIMKKIFSFLSIAVILVVFITACNSNTKAEADSLAKLRAYQDSVKLAADTAGLAQFQAWKAQNELTEEEMYGPNSASTAAASRSYAPVRTRSSSASRSSGSRSSSSGNTASAPAKKKGWSKAAKGAAIGGAAGAIGGAIINKRNRVVGGVVGGIIGAGVGYGIGRSKDKKDGRY
jgi:cobalamin biosynthesis Mg chelatase CobN